MDACLRWLRLVASLLVFVVLVSTGVGMTSPNLAAQSEAGAPAKVDAAPLSTPVPPEVLFRQGLVLPNGTGSDPDSMQAGKPTVLFDGGAYKMWYYGCSSSYACTIDYATSGDGRVWSKHGAVLGPAGALEQLVAYPSVIKIGLVYWMFYTGYDYSTYRIFAAASLDGITWARQGLVLDVGSPGAADSYGVQFPAVLYNGTGLTMWYTGTDGPTPPNAWILRATSPDGLAWTKHGQVLPRGPPGSLDAYQAHSAYVQVGGPRYQMMYSGSPNSSVNYILYADSPDGVSWQKRGLALAPLPGIETQIGGPAFVVSSNQSWDVWYGVRNDVSDVSIYLAVSDSEPPTTQATTVGTLGRDGWYVSNVTVLLTAHDTMSGIGWTNYSVDAGPETVYSSPFVVPQGNHTLTYRSTDGAGNVETQHWLAFYIDRTPPTSRLQLHGTVGNAGWYLTPVTLDLSATDDVSGVAGLTYSLDAGSWQTYAAPLVLDDGVHEFLFRAMDVAGNQEGTNVALVKVDSNGPVSQAHVEGSIGEHGWYVSPVTVNLTGLDQGSGLANVSYRTGAGSWQTYESPLLFDEGDRNLSYRATDVAGNTEGVHTLRIPVDTAPPSVQLVLPDHATQSVVRASWSGSDSVSGLDRFELSVDGGAYLGVGRSTSTNLTLADGAHTILLRAVDVAGNTATAFGSITIDTNAFSLAGPYSGLPILLIIIAAILVVAFVLWRRRSKQRTMSEPPVPPPPEAPKGL